MTAMAAKKLARCAGGTGPTYSEHGTKEGSYNLSQNRVPFLLREAWANSLKLGIMNQSAKYLKKSQVHQNVKEAEFSSEIDAFFHI